MPVEGLQRRVVELLRPNRSKESFVGGSSVFNATFPRRSEDGDIYTHATVGHVADRDVATLRGAGLTVEVNDRFHGFSVEATVSDGATVTKLEWNEADKERFFPVKEDPEFGWTLHRADLAVQKLVAAATRRKPRDAVDVALIDAMYAPAALLAIAAPAKLGPVAPMAILDRVLENAIGHPMADYAALDVDHEAMPFALSSIKTVLAERMAKARETIVDRCPTAVAGYLYTGADGRIGLPTVDEIRRLSPRTLTERGAFGAIGTTAVSLRSWRSKDPYERG